MPSAGKSKRQQLVELQSEVEMSEAVAMRKLGKLLKSQPMTKLIADMEALKEDCLPGSIAEKQLLACINVPNNVVSWLSTTFPEPVEPTESPISPAPVA